jgi:glycine cleavage system H protein
MNMKKSTAKDLYYTKEHEWIDFQGSVAYIGMCCSKLKGFRQIQEISFNDPSGFKKQGDVIATVKYNDHQVDTHMPIDGKVLQVNDKLVSGNPNMLLDCAETSGWIALIAPSLPHDRKDLLLPKQYQMNGKSKYAK